MRPIKILFSIFFFSVFLMACEKLPEGGTAHNFKKTFKSNPHAYVRWDLEKYLVSGIDSTDFVVSNNDPELRKNYVCFFKYSHDTYIGLPGDTRSIDLHKSDFSIISDSGAAFDSVTTVSKVKVGIRRVMTPEGPKMTWNFLKCKEGDLVLGSTDGKYRLEFRKHE